MSKVYNNNLIKSIIAAFLVVVFTVTIILLPFNTVYAADSDNGVVVTDTEISYNGFTIPRLLNTSDPVFDSYYSLSSETSSPFYCYFYLPSLNFVVFYNYYVNTSQTGKILSFDASYSAKVNTSANNTTGSYGYNKYVFDLNNHVLYNHINWSYNVISLSKPSVNTSNNYWFYYTSPDSSSCVRIYDDFYDSSLTNFTEAVVLYANYDINGWYDYDDSDYELPYVALSYQYLFYRHDIGYVFIDSGEKLSDLDTSLTNVNNSGSFTSSLWIRWGDFFNKFVYYSYDGSFWSLLNSGDVYGTYYNTSNSVVCSVLGIPSGNSVSVWSYFQDSPNIPDDLIMTEFESGESIGQTIEFDSGSGEYTSGSSISDIVNLYTPQYHIYSPNIYLASSTFEPNLSQFDNVATDIMDQLIQGAAIVTSVCSWPNYSEMMSDLFLNTEVYLCIGTTPLGIKYNFFVTDNQPSVGDVFDCYEYLTATSSAHISGGVFSAGFDVYHTIHEYVTVEGVETYQSPVMFFKILLDSLDGINDNILTFDTNVQTGFSNLTSQVKSLFDSSVIGNSYLFQLVKDNGYLSQILDKLDNLVNKPGLDLSGLDLSGIEEKLQQLIDEPDLLTAWDSNSFLFPVYSQNGLILSKLTSIDESVGDIANDLDSDSLGSIAAFVAQFRLSSDAMAAMISDISAGVGSFGNGMSLFSASASKLFEAMPSGAKILIITGPIFIVSTGLMYGARKIFG